MRTESPALAFGRPSRTAARPFGIKPGLFYSVFAGLLGTNVLTAIAFMMSPDIATLMSGQNELVLSAYEDRIAQLRVEVDRLQSRHYAQAGDLNLQLQELVQQQEVLSEQHQYVELLAKKAAELGIVTAGLPDSTGIDDAVQVVGSFQWSGSAFDDVERTGNQIEQMMGQTQMAMAAIGAAANESTTQILAELRGIGIKPTLAVDIGAVGGPLLPADDGPDSGTLLADANAVMDALSNFKAAKQAIDSAPIHRPIAGKARISSVYGNRRDPFTRGRAFHAGIDFPQPTGTNVLSAGEGVVVFAGKRSGYGNLVEIDHGHGLTTRYGHLSAFLVKEGQKVKTGTPIAKVGSTGRSTGPHLHFEVRKGNAAVDPAPYLATGKRLARFLG